MPGVVEMEGYLDTRGGRLPEEMRNGYFILKVRVSMLTLGYQLKNPNPNPNFFRAVTYIISSLRPPPF